MFQKAEAAVLDFKLREELLSQGIRPNRSTHAQVLERFDLSTPELAGRCDARALREFSPREREVLAIAASVHSKALFKKHALDGALEYAKLACASNVFRDAPLRALDGILRYVHGELPGARPRTDLDLQMKVACPVFTSQALSWTGTYLNNIFRLQSDYNPSVRLPEDSTRMQISWCAHVLDLRTSLALRLVRDTTRNSELFHELLGVAVDAARNVSHVYGVVPGNSLQFPNGGPVRSETCRVHMARSHYHLGVVESIKENHEDAQVHFRRCIAAPSTPRAWWAPARVYDHHMQLRDVTELARARLQ